MLDQILDTDTPGTPYNPNDHTTWARQYLTGSLDPGLRLGLGGDFYLGGAVALAVSRFQDDKQDGAKVVSDYAILGGPYLQWGDSKLSFQFVDVGPNYFAPLAQMRQDLVTSVVPGSTGQASPTLFQPLLRPQTLMPLVGRPRGYLTFYDRTMDNVFPYGLATPNRRGYGVELDVQTLEKKALKLLGSAYLVQEMNGNLVVNIPQIGYIPVEDPTGALVPVRDFIHVNFGPSIDLGPLVGWDRPLELGVNVRFENTSSVVGDLTSLWALGGLRVGVLPFCQVAGSFGVRDFSGREMGYVGSFMARTPYLFDNGDLGYYTVVDMAGTVTHYSLSLLFPIDRHSNLMVDYSMVSGDAHPTLSALPGDLHNQFMGLSYEVEF
jgi:hypothetical protein